MKLTVLYLAAGASSRFGGRIKALARVGPNNQTLLELSMRQAKAAGFERIVIIASDKTITPLTEEFGDEFEGLEVAYCLQKTPEYRKKPFGTSHATLSAKELISGPFAILNGDDLYGTKTLHKVAHLLKGSKDVYCIPGYRLKNSLPAHGTVNRGVISVQDDGSLDKITETFNISKADIPHKFSGDELVSMNLFGLQPEFFTFVEKRFETFLQEYPDDPSTEFLLPTSVSEFIAENGISMQVIPTEDTPLGLTNPEDEQVLREQLKHFHV